MRKGDNEREYRCKNTRAQKDACVQRGRETIDELSGWLPEQWVQGVTRMRRGAGTPGDP